MRSLRVAAAQINPTVGDLSGNVELVLAAIVEAERIGCDLIALPELAITGYPPEDLLLKEGFVADARRALDEVAAASGDCAVIVGAVVPAAELIGRVGPPSDSRSADAPLLANVAAVCAHGQLVALIPKRLLPNYAVFDEQRRFVPGAGAPQLLRIADAVVGVAVCEDLWTPGGPAATMAEVGAELVVSINASPFSIGQHARRRQIVADRVSETGCAVVYVNQVGGQDELVFDGGSVVVGDDGRVVAEAPTFLEHLLVADLVVHGDVAEVSEALVEISGASRRIDPADLGEVATPRTEEGEIYAALVLGTRDYLAKNGFADVVIGLSGGIDSAIVAAIAVDALGRRHVRGIAMPSRYSSDHSISDAEDLAGRLGIRLDTIPIEPAHGAYAAMLRNLLGGEPAGLTDENLQSRLRGVLLMAVSNDTGAIVLTTGNKSEMATGYSTLYGDSAGGFAVIKDVPKTLVYDLCRWRNDDARAAGLTPPIPDAILSKPPSAELRPDQVDEDSLPAYELLDPILSAIVEFDRTVPELVAAGHDPALVERVARLVDIAEYKRRQMPPGVRISSKAFGKDRRMPITNRYRPLGPTRS